RTTQQPSPAKWCNDDIKLSNVLNHLHGCSTLASDDVGMIEGRNHGAALLFGDAVADSFPILRVAVVEHHLGSIPACGIELVWRCIFRHHDRGFRAEKLRREGNRLGMITGAKRNHTALHLIWR